MPVSLKIDDNQLLMLLPADVLGIWKPHLEFIELQAGHVLCEANRPLNFVYFPTSAIVSLLRQLEDGFSTEIAVVGNEGVVGLPILLGGGSSPDQALVQQAGYALRLDAHFIKHHWNLERPSQYWFLRYIQALLTQMSQTAICNRHHALERQLCRWLLLRLDRLPSNQLAVTQDLIAGMLGVRRQGITACTQKLQTEGVIRASRGSITVLDRAELERRTCECYPHIAREYARLIPRTSLSRAGDS